MLRLLGRNAARQLGRRSQNILLREVRAVRLPLALNHRSIQSTASLARSLGNSSESIEHIYQKKTPLEHVLLRPGMYIGSIESAKEDMWIWNEREQKMTQKTLEYVPALYKIFDEILVNAVDNKVRDDSMSRLEVDIVPGDKSTPPKISVFNDGKGIPIQFHKHEKLYVPELVLGHLLTGSNFNDSAARLTGGRHGYGAKLTNIFSTEFSVETGDAKAGKRYKQVWRNNMRERGEPAITAYDGPNFTHITFSPDLEKFHMDTLNADMVDVLTQRVMHVAGCLPNVDVKINKKSVPINGFESFVKAFEGATSKEGDYLYAKVNKRWEVGVLPSDFGYTQVSFVNGISTTRGGTHVQLVTDQICRRIAEAVQSRHKDLSGIQSSQIKPHLSVFVKCLIENPTFDSQMKECLTSKPEFYGSTCALSEKFMKQLINSSGIVERVIAALKTKQRTALIKKVAKKSVQVPKLEDANWAGTAKSNECTLILTEGDSAKALAVAGLSVVGRDRYGVFPLRGKFLNVRDATDSQLSKNAEFGQLCTILGLKPGATYKTEAERASLRYGHVMIMTDQDHDGSHIKGLLLNLFHKFWPELLESHFVSAFLTPLLKVHTSKEVIPFYSIPEYQTWKDQNSKTKHTVKYYKGLGTSTSKEGKEYFEALVDHQVGFTWEDAQDGDALAMVFSKDRAADRKLWLSNSNPKDYVFERLKEMPIRQFVHSELIQFSHADNIRSIPSVIDGLKPSQRKVLYACFRRNLTKEMKVAQLAGYCAEHTAYHHGEASLHSTIINMAQDYVGSNNLPLLYPSGQFGTRLQGGKDAASPRYIFTHLQPYTRLLFPPSDEPLLEYVEDDGLQVEPTHYVPIIPLLLVNGADGIGTGWSTKIPSHHPIQLIDRLLERLDQKSESTVYLEPWVRGFSGTISQRENGYVTEGSVKVLHKKKRSLTLEVSELPLGKWVEDYKAFLWGLVSTKKITSFTEHHTDEAVKFEIVVPIEENNEVETTDWGKWLKLESNINTTNMHAFDAHGTLQKYSSSEEILDAYYPVRLALYEKRKAYLCDKISRELKLLDNRVRFVQAMMLEGSEISKVMYSRPTKKLMIEALRQAGFDSIHSIKLEADDGDVSELSSNGFDYLLKTSFLQFTQEYTNKLLEEYQDKKAELVNLESTSSVEMWKNELLGLRAALMADPLFHRDTKKI